MRFAQFASATEALSQDSKAALAHQAALLCAAALQLPFSSTTQAAESLTRWTPVPDSWRGATVHESGVHLTGEKWSYLFAPEEHSNAEVAATFTITEAAKRFRFFGESWSVWPDSTFGDGGFEAAVLLRAGETSGYRLQFSHRYQALALVKWPEGGYVRVVPCPLKLNEAHRVVARAQGTSVTVSVDGAERIRWSDTFLPLAKGGVGLGVSSQAKVAFTEVVVKSLDPTPTLPAAVHLPRFSVRSFLGERPWVFDGDEPILLLPVPKANGINNVKLRPGYKPQLSWNSHWDVQNQGAYKEADNKNTEPTWNKGGETLTAQWTSEHINGAFVVKTSMLVGWDASRQVYTYDVDSTMEVMKDFTFRYGYDFEHHTPLDPFRWQYLIAKRSNGEFYHRPVYPVDPGPQYDLETIGGSRVWFGRHGEAMHLAPAVEYNISSGQSLGRKLNTAVCAAFYDTGVSFPGETAKAGTRLSVNYRYTGLPAEEAEAIFKSSRVYESPTLDPLHHYIFADEWPKLTFSQFVPMSETWQHGRTPFMSAHNQRPSYELLKDCGAGSGFAMKLGPASFAKANLAKAAPLAKGRYVMTALVKSVNVHGPGGRIELTATQAKTNKKLSEALHFVGTGSFEWERQGFPFEVSEEAASLSVAFGNAGTGEFLVTDVEFHRLKDGEELPSGVSATPNNKAPFFGESIADAVADFRLAEGAGLVAFNHAGGPHLELANVDWVVDSGRPALRFANTAPDSQNFRKDRYIGLNIFGYARDFNYLGAYKAYEGKQSVPFAMSLGGALVLGTERYYLHSSYYRGLIGRTLVVKRSLSAEDIEALSKDALPASSKDPGTDEVTLAAWIKPADTMEPGKGMGGDIMGYGNRKFILTLADSPPYRLVARLNESKQVLSSGKQIEANRWHHVALTVKPKEGTPCMHLFIDGQQVAEGFGRK
jgi:hypothetical protein